ncbi:hypothetical protein B0H14DRAFT_2400427, partial [Mycena olivaceomarginata]
LPHCRLRGSMRRINHLGSVLRNHQAVDRQKYSVPHLNYLWHLNGHHKLIQWGIEIHGIVDGYCQTVRFFYTASVLIDISCHR